MGKPQFEFPDNVQEVVQLLNDSEPDSWNISVIQESEALYVFSGDQVMLVAATEQEVLDFLAGAFLATFNGKGLAQIKREVAVRIRQDAE